MDELVPPLPPGRALDLGDRGRSWVWEAAGPPGAPTVVLLHGWMSTAALNWSACFEPLSQHFRVVALDHQGHGRGIHGRRTFSLEDCADDVAALIRTLDAGPAIVVGYSMGGPIAQLTWRRHPDEVGGLVLCATADQFATRPELHDVVRLLGNGLSIAVSALPAAWRRRGYSRAFGDRNPDTPLAQWAAAEREASDPAALIQAGVALNGFDSRGWIETITVPTAVIVTSEDQVVSPVRQWRMARSIPDARIVPIAAGHRACADALELFIPMLVQACHDVAPPAHSHGGAVTPPLGESPLDLGVR